MSGLIETPAQIWVAVVPVDMRRGLDGLSAIVQQSLGHSPCAGSAFIFRNRAGNRLRLLLWDGNGVWLCQRRLHQGSFVWPKAGDAVFSINQAQWQWLVAGVDWQRLPATAKAEWQV
ncbi:IS66 family insertion sequence element accessory protein TnpB [Methylomonas sp. UP202]|uniref:IS66 family insertion sequence element accessory protein TnpB n=1 Tax=Methylomonas sp. UP202 TaxID=3040943 RepID=UPI00247924DD|nr:IS66 family insertion sequence element accessory protein TnpB [Methylomonas sp. UP202]WGS84987.1 IS66 family insertion sequence element accessory protein TnpB [Methylomonas sp. UP202]WGS85043.1 IS66 family insertion sequence element accessory protein TnpB [Methylomonas sp. UP202]WGS86181.1 IS66 family insertion sequence element accessory protein TnpB [Methylomonas sp. UP202]